MGYVKRKMSIVKAVTCPVCGCLCDDIELSIEDGKIVKVKNGCAMCESKFLSHNSEHRIRKPLIRKNGELVEASMEEAVKKAAEILAGANYPILYGWSSTSCEATRVGLESAEEIGGVIDNTAVVCHGPSILSIQEIGIPSCTLGQIRHRADLVVYWGSLGIIGVATVISALILKHKRIGGTNSRSQDLQQQKPQENRENCEIYAASAV
jgi:Formylmethanofuran dehydrogenase subunit B